MQLLAHATRHHHLLLLLPLLLLRAEVIGQVVVHQGPARDGHVGGAHRPSGAARGGGHGPAQGGHAAHGVAWHAGGRAGGHGVAGAGRGHGAGAGGGDGAEGDDGDGGAHAAVAVDGRVGGHALGSDAPDHVLARASGLQQRMEGHACAVEAEGQCRLQAHHPGCDDYWWHHAAPGAAAASAAGNYQ